MRLRRALVFLFGLAAVGPPSPGRADDDGDVRVAVSSHSVEFGTKFTLAVERTWTHPATAAAFDPACLAPLVVDLRDSSKRTDGDRTRETLTFVARAFVRERATITASFELRAGDGTTRTVEALPVTLVVTSSLAAATTAPPELPGDILPAPHGSAWMWLVALAIVASTLVLWFARRRPRPPLSPAIPSTTSAPDCGAMTLLHLSALRARPLHTPTEIAIAYVEASAILRTYAGERFALAAREMTTDEVLAALATASTLTPPALDRLARVLRPADLVKFACHVPAAADVATMLIDAEAFVRATGAAPQHLAQAVS